jgi:hypothetical protein
MFDCFFNSTIWLNCLFNFWTSHSPKNPPMDEWLCLRSPPPQRMRWKPGLGATIELEALNPECTYPSTQNGRIPPNPEKGNTNPNSQIQSAKSKSCQIKTNQDKPYIPILPLTWLALAFDKFSTDVAPRGSHTCQALQWIEARSV